MQADTHLPIKDFVEATLKAAHISGEVIFVPTSDHNISIKIAVDTDQGYVIGRHGTGLEALQHLVALIARKNGSENQYRVDVNDYQQERDGLFLKKVTDFIASRTDETEILLWTMNAYERRLVHEYFLKANTYSTQSEDIDGKRVVRLVKK